MVCTLGRNCIWLLPWTWDGWGVLSESSLVVGTSAPEAVTSVSHTCISRASTLVPIVPINKCSLLRLCTSLLPTTRTKS